MMQRKPCSCLDIDKPYKEDPLDVWVGDSVGIRKLLLEMGIRCRPLPVPVLECLVVKYSVAAC